MKRVHILTTAAAAALLLGGCSAPPAQEQPTVSVEPATVESTNPTPTATPTPSQTKSEPEPEMNARGQLIKEIGEVGGFVGVDGKNTMSFKVTSIAEAECDAPYAQEPNGIPLAVTLEIETTGDFEGPVAVNGQPGMIGLQPYYWKGYAENGTRMNTVDTGITHSCLADETQLLPDYIGKGERVTGKVILDVTTPTGSIAFEPGWGAAWIWEYPS